MKNPITQARRRDAVIALVERKCRGSGANDRQRTVATVMAVSLFNRGESGFRSVCNGIAICEIFIQNNITEPTFSNCNVLPFPGKNKRMRFLLR